MTQIRYVRRRLTQMNTRAQLKELAPNEFAGYASLFNVADNAGDIVAPGAFAASLRKRPPHQVRMLYQHFAHEPIGVWDVIREDARGLYVKGHLTTDIERARDVAALFRDGALDGLSIGFRTQRATRNPDGTRTLTEIELWEISVVTFPMLAARWRRRCHRNLEHASGRLGKARAALRHRPRLRRRAAIDGAPQADAPPSRQRRRRHARRNRLAPLRDQRRPRRRPARHVDDAAGGGTTMSASLALQTAIFAALAADTNVKAALGDPPRLYDDVPRNAAFPYATLGDARESDWSTKTEEGSEHRLTLTVFSRASGHKEAKEIAATLIDALEDATPAPDGHTLISLRFEDATHTRDPDGLTTRTTLHYRAVTEPA